MLYELLHEPIRLFSYLTFRSALALFSAVTILFALGPWFIRRIRAVEFLQEIRDEGPEEHKSKAGTPTMGGILIVVGTLVPTLLWADLSNVFIQAVCMALILFAAVGGADDTLKIIHRENKGLTARQKFLLQILCALILFAFIHWQFPPITVLPVPFFKNVALHLGAFYILAFLLVGTNEFKGMAELGVVCGVGLAMVLAATLLAIPALFCFFGEKLTM